MSVPTRKTDSKSKPKRVRQWLSGVAGVLLLTSVVLPLSSAQVASGEKMWWTVRAPALVLGLIMLALFVSQSRRNWAVGLTIAALLVPLLPRLGGDTRDYWWMFRVPLVVLTLMMLARFVWNRRRNLAAGSAIALVLLLAVLFAFWLFWNTTTPLSGVFPLTTAGVGYYGHLAGLGATAIAGIAHAFPERRDD